ALGHGQAQGFGPALVAEIHGRHLPAALGGVHGVAAFALGQQQQAAGRQRIELLAEIGIRLGAVGVGHEQAAGEEADDGYQRHPLQVRKPRYGMARGAAARVARAEAHQEAAQHQEHPAFPVGKVVEGKQLAGQQAGEVREVHFGFQVPHRGGRDTDNVGVAHEAVADEATQRDAEHEHQVPDFGPPVISQKGNAGRHAGRAHVAQRGADAQRLIPHEQQRGHRSLTYPFAGWARGLRGQLLYVYKGALGNTYGEDRYIVNKVDFHQLNVILNYDF
nr:hypothetical protein [Tanacetum cinerariifolium]